MLGKIPSQKDNESIKPIEIGDLSMGTKDIPVDNRNHSHLFKITDSPPKGSFATPWLRCHLGFFRVNISVIRPKPKEPKDYLTLTRSQFQNIVKAVTDAIMLLEKELR